MDALQSRLKLQEETTHFRTAMVCACLTGKPIDNFMPKPDVRPEEAESGFWAGLEKLAQQGLIKDMRGSNE